MRIAALRLNAIHAVHLVLQEVPRIPAVPDPLRATAAQACVGYPSLESVRDGLWSTQPDQVAAWRMALRYARPALDQLLVFDADADFRDIARWAGRYFPTSSEFAGCRAVQVPGRGWTLEFAE